MHLPDVAQAAAQPPQQCPAPPPAQAHEQAAALLPRFPMGLAYIGSRQAYAALATAMRMTGRLAVLGATGRSQWRKGCAGELTGNSKVPRCLHYC